MRTRGEEDRQGDLFASPPATPEPPPTPVPAPQARESEVVTVGELTERISRRMKELGRVSVEGEVSSLKRAASGHVYFGLKDKDALLDCKIWRSRVSGALRFPLEEGTRVVCHGNLDVYRPRGSYSLIVDRVEQRGIGELLARLEELKQDLKQRGWFDRRRSLPALPRVLGVVTSRDGAAFQDFLRTRTLRWPLYPLRLAHTPVQGAGAAREIASAIRSLDRSGVDSIAVVRGGGSLEDLWCFNEREPAEAIWECSVPVVTGVGHETDVTLVDYVADHRAHTPTDAAQTVIPERAALEREMERIGGYLFEAMEGQLEGREARLGRVGEARCLKSADWLLAQRFETLGSLRRRLRLAGERRLEATFATLRTVKERLARQSPSARVAALEGRLAALVPRLVAGAQESARGRERRIAVLERGLGATSPFAVLARGYSITRRAGEGRPLTEAGELSAGDTLETLLHDGTVLSDVTRARAERAEDGDEA